MYAQRGEATKTNPKLYFFTGEVHTSKIFLYRPSVQERDNGCYTFSRVPPDRGSGGRLWTNTGTLDGNYTGILQKVEHYKITF